MNGQVSVEMLIVIGLGLVIVGIYAIYGYSSIDAYTKGSDELLMKDSLEKVAQTAKFVSLQGIPAKQQINICLPASFRGCNNLNGSAEMTCNLTGNRIIQHDMGANVTGTLPNNSGCWKLTVEAKETVEAKAGYVNLTVI